LRRRAEDASTLSKEWSDNILGFYTVRLQPNILVSVGNICIQPKNADF
jgi:hypothetical protein